MNQQPGNIWLFPNRRINNRKSVWPSVPHALMNYSWKTKATQKSCRMRIKPGSAWRQSCPQQRRCWPATNKSCKESPSVRHQQQRAVGTARKALKTKSRFLSRRNSQGNQPAWLFSEPDNRGIHGVQRVSSISTWITSLKVRTRAEEASSFNWSATTKSKHASILQVRSCLGFSSEWWE